MSKKYGFFDYFMSGTRRKRQTGRFGIEIETEVPTPSDHSKNIDFDENPWRMKGESLWTPTSDNSLRNFGVEFILTDPLSLDGVKKALEEFDKRFSGTPFIKDAPGTSVHVHVNIQDFTVTEIANFCTIWTLFENLLIEFCGETRRSNLFALPSRCSEGNVKLAVELFEYIERTKNLYRIDEGYGKYAALNLCCLYSLGSLEVRSFRGCTDGEKIFEWVRILNRISEASKRFDNPHSILDMYQSRSLDLLFNIFDDETDLLIGEIESPQSFIERNLYYAARIADSVYSWEVLEDSLVEKASKGGSQATRGKKAGVEVTLNEVGEINPHLAAVFMQAAQSQPTGDITFDEVYPAEDEPEFEPQPIEEEEDVDF